MDRFEFDFETVTTPIQPIQFHYDSGTSAVTFVCNDAVLVTGVKSDGTFVSNLISSTLQISPPISPNIKFANKICCRPNEQVVMGATGENLRGPLTNLCVIAIGCGEIDEAACEIGKVGISGKNSQGTFTNSGGIQIFPVVSDLSSLPFLSVPLVSGTITGSLCPKMSSQRGETWCTLSV